MRATWLWLLLGLGLPALGAAPPALSVDEIVRRHVEARGGLEKLRALRVLKREGHAVIPGAKIQLDVTEVRSASGEVRVDQVLQGMRIVDAWDGKVGWKVRPFEGRKDPERMSADETKGMRLSADVAGPLVDWKAKGHRVTSLGLESLDGSPVYKLRIDLAWGDQIISYVDPDSFMVLREVQRTTIRGAERYTEVDYGDYEKVGGVYVPMLEESGTPGAESTSKEKVVYEKAEAVASVDSTLFVAPGGAR